MIGGKQRLCNCCGLLYKYQRAERAERCRICRHHHTPCRDLKPASVIQWSGDQVRYFQKPCVYIYERPDGTALYVGCGKHGLARVLDYRPGNSRHSITEAGRNQARRECAKLHVRFFESYTEARTEETRLIRTLKPAYNSTAGKTQHQRAHKAHLQALDTAGL